MFDPWQKSHGLELDLQFVRYFLQVEVSNAKRLIIRSGFRRFIFLCFKTRISNANSNADKKRSVVRIIILGRIKHSLTVLAGTRTTTTTGPTVIVSISYHLYSYLVYMTGGGKFRAHTSIPSMVRTSVEKLSLISSTVL